MNILTGKDVAQSQVTVNSDAAFFFGIVDGALNIDIQVLKYLGVIGWFFRCALSEYRVNKDESDQCDRERIE